MKKIFFNSILLITVICANAQETDSVTNQYANSADKLLLNDNRLVVGGYGEVHYNQVLNSLVYNNGMLDVHRVVMLFGYNFNRKTQFITELEFEHVKEVYVEQAFLQHKLNRFINFRAGLMLIPMGLINEYHEPTTFHGVERPLIDKYITPTTWREIGVGISGTILPASLKYQAYLVNGFNGYDGVANIQGNSGLRGGRQKGAESFVSAPNFTAKLEYYGVRGVNIGLSGYLGQTQSTLYNNIEKDDDKAVSTADSSVVGLSMLGVDARYNNGGIQFRGQFYYAQLSNTMQYNAFTTNTAGTFNDVGSAMIGYYFEAAYNVLRPLKTSMKLMPFARYSFLNTHHSVESNTLINKAYEKTIVTTGITLELTQGAVVKADMQFVKDAESNKYNNTFNAGIGVMF